MLCDDCGNREASVHITQITPDGKLEKNLCPECAAKYGGMMFIDGNHGFRVNDFLKGVFSQPAKEAVLPQDAGDTVCPNCGMNYRNFATSGKLGCSVCYETFRDRLTPLLSRIHGSSHHSGKIPVRAGGTLMNKRRLAILKEQLKKAVEAEEYEKAVEYRDQIRAMEAQGGEG